MGHNLEDTARGILETLLKRRLSDQAWVKNKKTIELLGLPFNHDGLRLYAQLKTHVGYNLDKLVGVKGIPLKPMTGAEIRKDMESRNLYPKSNSTFHRWFQSGFRVNKTFSELEVSVVYMHAFIYQKRQAKTKQIGESDDN